MSYLEFAIEKFTKNWRLRAEDDFVDLELLAAAGERQVGECS
jgi:hypothetical protein